MMRALQLLLECPRETPKPRYNPNQQKILDVIGSEPLSISEISELTGIPNRTVHSVMSELKKELKVIDAGRHRPRLYYK